MDSGFDVQANKWIYAADGCYTIAGGYEWVRHKGQVVLWYSLAKHKWRMQMCFCHVVSNAQEASQLDSKFGRTATKRPHWKGFRVVRTTFSCRDMKRNYRILAILPHRYRNRNRLLNPSHQGQC